MGLETATYISDLNVANPAAGDAKSQGDDHLRLIKSTVKATFPNVTGAVSASHTELNSVTSRALKAGDTYTGTHDFTGGAVTVPTRAVADNTTNAASTAFVRGEINAATAFVTSQANAASASASAAASSASSASSSASAAAASLDSFDDRYLGSKTSDPTLDNDGNALLTGALYWSSTGSVMKVWSGSAWVTFNPVNNPVDQTDIGTAANEIPLNQYLGVLAYRDTALVRAPASATADGLPGQIAADSGFFYVCTAVNTWVRVALATW